MAMESEAKVRENRLRRAAERQGLRLTRSRRRDPLALDYGLYWLTQANGDHVAALAGVSLDEIEEWLTRPRPPKNMSPPTG